MQPNFTIQDILKGDVAQLEQLFRSAAAPSPAASLRTTTAEKFSAFLLKGEQFDLALSSHLIGLQHALQQQLAQDDSFYCNTEHPLRHILHTIVSRSSHWYARDAKNSQQFLEKLAEVMQACVRGEIHAMQKSHGDFLHWLESEDKRAAMLETRLCETEINHFKMLSAESRVLDLINGALAFKLFPSDYSAGIVSVLKNELLHCYFTAGNDNPFWKQWQRLLPMLGKMCVIINMPERSEDDEQTLYRTIPALLNELENSLSHNTSNSDQYRQWVEGLSEQLMRAIKKQPIQCEAFIALSYPEGYSNLNTRVTADVLQQTNDLQIGDWILFNGETGQVIRCKLVLKSAEIDQLLFVDHTGRKVMSKSIKDFAICLSTGIAKKLVPINIEDTIAKIIQALIDLHHQKQLQFQAQQEAQHARELAEAELHKQAEERRRQEIEAETKRQIVAKLAERQAAAQKALAEAAALAEERARRNAELALEQERVRLQLEAEQAAENLQRVQLANIHISSLNLGARVELIINNEPIRCKLAVIIAATGKYIFVDNLGRKVAELQREHLVQALLDSQLTLLNNGDSFDDQLVKVIRGLRKDIS